MVAMLLAGSVALASTGWRNDGSSVFADGVLPASWTAPSWSARLPGAGNSSPVEGGGLVFVTSEPDAVTAVDARTGAAKWTRHAPIIEALPAAMRAEIEGRLANASKLDTQLADTRRELSLLLRQARSATDPSQFPVDATAKRLDSLQAQADSIAPYRTDLPAGLIGLASPTPTFGGAAAFALFGNGVVARFEADGRRSWIAWRGSSSVDKRGATGRDTSSPILVGDLLIVPYGRLAALSAADGRVVWESDKWSDFGTPALMNVGGRDLLFTPDGHAIDARSGATVAKDLGDVVYHAPVVAGSMVVYAGANTDRSPNAAPTVAAWKVSVSGGAVSVTRAWETTLESHDRVLGSPVLVDGKIFVVSRARSLWVLDAATGRVLHTGQLGADEGEVRAPLVATPSRVIVTTIVGSIIELDRAAPYTTLATHRMKASHATPVFDRGGLLWRADDTLLRYAAP